MLWNNYEQTCDELLDCPFCGARPEYVCIGNESTRNRGVEIKCPMCLCKRATMTTLKGYDWVLNTAKERWNMRPEKRSPLPDGTLPLTEEERGYISENYLGYMFSEITVRRHTMHGDIGLFLFCGCEVRIDDLRIILWLAERFNLLEKEVCDV